jgi:hypothetical protein
MLRPAPQHRSCARSGEREGFWRLSKTVRHDTFGLPRTSCGHRPTEYDWQRVHARTGQHYRRVACVEPGVRVGVRRGCQPSILVHRGQIDALRNTAIMQRPTTVIVGVRIVTVWMRMVMARRCGRPVVIGAKRTVQQQRKRRHDGQGRRQTLELQTDGMKHHTPIHVALAGF